MNRVGFGFDVHPFSDDPQRVLVLGACAIQGAPGLVGHSDADVISHAITDAILGASGHGDMGQHFPDTDPQWKGADSVVFLRAASQLIVDDGWTLDNVDCTVVLERPKVSPYRNDMQQRLSEVLNAPVNVKATRAEGLGAIGRVEGIACWAVASLTSNQQSRTTT